MDQSVSTSQVIFIIDLCILVIFVIVAIVMSRKIGNIIVSSITEPLLEVEKVAEELTKGNLHSNLEYHSEDEIGRLAHSLRKSIRILGSYVDDIAQTMGEFSNGNFIVNPDADWKGDFVDILEAFKIFEKNMAGMVKTIQSVADQVKNGSEQVAASASDLAEGATEQASITQELAATVESVSERVLQNAEN